MFENPFAFLFLPLLLLLGWWVLKQVHTLPFSSVHLISGHKKSWKTQIWWLPEAFRLLALGAMVFALAGPFLNQDSDNRVVQGLRIALVIDRSGSMGYEVPLKGEWISRLEGVKKLTGDFLSSRKNDQIALLSFARYPETHSPLTQNTDVLRDFIQVITPPTKAAEDGTSIGDALFLAQARLEASRGPDQPPGIIILLTDGQNNAGKKLPQEAAKSAKERGIRIYSIGLRGQGTLVQETGFGRQRMPVGSDLDEETLQTLATISGGESFPLDNLEDLSELYKNIDNLERSRLLQAQPEHRTYDIVVYLTLAMIFLTLEWLFSLVILRRVL